MVIGKCPDCNQTIEIKSEPAIGQDISCQFCHVDLEITWLYPLCLDYREIRDYIDKSETIEV